MKSRFALLLAALLSGCRGPEGLPLVLDLAAATPAADREGPWRVISFGTPAGIAAQFSGFYDAPLAPSGDTAAWVARDVELGFRLASVEPRVALLDLAPFPGVASQGAEIFLNGERVGGFGLTPARRRYRVGLAVKLQREGVNRMRIRFAAAGASQKTFRRRMAAVLYGLSLVPASDRSHADLVAPAAPPPLSADGDEVTLAAPLTLRYALRAPEAGELRFTPALHPAARAAGGRATLRVLLDEEGRGERTLWSGDVTAGQGLTGEVAVALGATPGARIVVGLRRDAGDQPHAWGVFRKPRILGSASRDPLSTLPLPTPVDRRADALRAGLGEASVVYVILDAAGARHFGAYGSQRPATPEFDRIAAEGVLFEDAYSVATFTHLSMGSAWTSVLPDQHHNGILPNAPLPEDRLTLAQLLSAHGIHTAGFVSNGVAGPGFALDRGFQEFDEVFKRLGAHAEAYRKVLPAWLRANAARRFFLYVHFREPHFAYDPPSPFDTMFGPDKPLTKAVKTKYDWITDVNWKRHVPSAAELEHLGRLYDGNLAYVDRELGELRRAMEAAGLWDRSLVIVTADHGDGLYEHEYIGHLDQVYEEQLRVPLVIKFPKGKGPRGQRVAGLVDTLDMAPTVADAFQVLGLDGSDQAFLGRSLLPVVLGAPTKQWVLARCAGEQPKYGLREGRTKVVYHTARDTAELYDIVDDPGEKNDLAPSRPLQTAYYRQAIRRLLLAMRRGPRAAAPSDAELTEEQRENLRALGYVQ
ncbi:MAG TPA: sulfatase [Vicinamibacteria bacterium]|nr:sulfatase [Vicinamibacteria bacterium]